MPFYTTYFPHLYKLYLDYQITTRSAGAINIGSPSLMSKAA